MKRLKSDQFTIGFLVCAALHSLHQDYLGRFGYMEHLQKYWLDARITVPLAILALVYCIWSWRSDEPRP